MSLKFSKLTILETFIESGEIENKIILGVISVISKRD